MPRFKLKVLQVRDETPTVRSVHLDLAGAVFPFKPGQYCLFAVKPGMAHSLSISNAPGQPYLEFACRKSDSAFKAAFWSLAEGDEVDIAGPLGGFSYDGGAGHAVFLSGGIGITPIKSMLEAAVNRGESDKLTLLFGNRTLSEIPFRHELEELAGKGVAVVSVVAEVPVGVDWGGKIGRIDETMVREAVPDLARAMFFICGPPAMVEGLTQLLKSMGVPEGQVRIEHFEGYQ